MKKLILKTALISLGSAIILLIAVFGLMSLCAPAVMMRLTSSMGLDNISGDYAYQEYERSGKISYLSRSFIVAATGKQDRSAEKRFEILYAHEDFQSFCAEQDALSLTKDKTVSYRAYICGLAAQMKYRMAETEEDKEELCEFAIDETEVTFPTGNPLVALATTAATNHDKEFCKTLHDRAYNSKFNTTELEGDRERNDFIHIMTVLTQIAYED